MSRCLQLARQGVLTARPNPMVGAVIVADDRIIGEGYHIRCGEGHAEVNAFASVHPADETLLHDATIYVSLEPCAHYGKTPPCADLIVNKGVRRVVVGCVDPFAKVQGRGIERIRQAGIEVTVGVMEEECRWLNRRFFTFHQQHRPYIVLKWARSADGFIDDHRQPAAISNDTTRRICHKLRAESDAILVGRVTAERDKPRLDTRLWDGPSPRRYVLSHTTTLPSLMQQMYDDGIQSLLVEGGAITHRSFMEAGLWDEIREEVSPCILGDGTAAPALPEDSVVRRQMTVGTHTITQYVNPNLDLG